MQFSYLSFCVFNTKGGEHKFAVYVMQSGCSLKRILSPISSGDFQHNLNVDAPSLETFKARLDGILDSLI